MESADSRSIGQVVGRGVMSVGEILCLKVWHVDVHGIHFVRPDQEVPELFPFFRNRIYLYMLFISINHIIEKEIVP